MNASCEVEPIKIAYATTAKTEPLYSPASIEQYGDDVDPCGLRKRLRVQVGAKPKCITFSGLGAETLRLEQMFGSKNCETRKPVGKIIDEVNCQVVLIKPGLYEFNTSDYGLFPEDFDFTEKKLSLEQTQLIIMAGNNGCVSVG